MTLILSLGLGIVGLTIVCSVFEATLYSTRLGFLQAGRDGKKHARAARRFIEKKKNIAVEQIVGVVQDEFDTEVPEIVSEGQRRYLVLGQLPLDPINREFELDLYGPDVDTLSGLLVSRMGRLLRQGDKVSLEGADAEVTEIRGGRATRVRLTLTRAVEPRLDNDPGQYEQHGSTESV